MNPAPKAQLNSNLESMELSELIEYGGENPKDREQIDRILRLKHKIDVYVISIRNPELSRPPAIYLITDQHYCITSLDLAMELIRHFGGLITRLECDWDSDREDEIIPLLELINQFCTNLIEVNLPTPWSKWLKTSFETVKAVTISGELDEHLNLNRNFPSMEELRMQNVEASDPFYIVGYYPHLKRLRSSYIYGPDLLVAQIFKKNPQINFLDAQNDASLDFLRSISITPQAEKLNTIIFYPRKEHFHQTIAPMHFNNLENFIVVTEERLRLPSLPFVFNSLKNLTCIDEYPIGNGVLRLPSDWYNIIPNCESLDAISMDDIKLSTKQLVDYSNRFPNLHSISFKLSGELCDDELIQFLQSTQIKSIEIGGIPVISSCDDVTNKLTDKWKYKFTFEMYTNQTQSLLLEQNSI